MNAQSRVPTQHAPGGSIPPPPPPPQTGQPSRHGSVHQAPRQNTLYKAPGSTPKALLHQAPGGSGQASHGVAGSTPQAPRHRSSIQALAGTARQKPPGAQYPPSWQRSTARAPPHPPPAGVQYTPKVPHSQATRGPSLSQHQQRSSTSNTFASAPPPPPPKRRQKVLHKRENGFYEGGWYFEDGYWYDNEGYWYPDDDKYWADDDDDASSAGPSHAQHHNAQEQQPISAGHGSQHAGRQHSVNPQYRSSVGQPGVNAQRGQHVPVAQTYQHTNSHGTIPPQQQRTYGQVSGVYRAHNPVATGQNGYHTHTSPAQASYNQRQRYSHPYSAQQGQSPYYHNPQQVRSQTIAQNDTSYTKMTQQNRQLVPPVPVSVQATSRNTTPRINTTSTLRTHGARNDVPPPPPAAPSFQNHASHTTKPPPPTRHPATTHIAMLSKNAIPGPPPPAVPTPASSTAQLQPGLGKRPPSPVEEAIAASERLLQDRPRFKGTVLNNSETKRRRKDSQASVSRQMKRLKISDGTDDNMSDDATPDDASTLRSIGGSSPESMPAIGSHGCMSRGGSSAMLPGSATASSPGIFPNALPPHTRTNMQSERFRKFLLSHRASDGTEIKPEPGTGPKRSGGLFGALQSSQPSSRQNDAESEDTLMQDAVSDEDDDDDKPCASKRPRKRVKRTRYRSSSMSDTSVSNSCDSHCSCGNSSGSTSSSNNTSSSSDSSSVYSYPSESPTPKRRVSKKNRKSYAERNKSQRSNNRKGNGRGRGGQRKSHTPKKKIVVNHPKFPGDTLENSLPPEIRALTDEAKRLSLVPPNDYELNTLSESVMKLLAALWLINGLDKVNIRRDSWCRYCGARCVGLLSAVKVCHLFRVSAKLTKAQSSKRL